MRPFPSSSRVALLLLTLVALRIPAQADPTALSDAQAAVAAEKSVFNLSRLGRAQLESGQLDAAEKTAAEIARLDPSTEDAAALRAQIALARKQTDAAFKFFDEAVRLAPDHSAVFTARGRARHNLKQGDRGLADFNRAIQVSDNNDTDALLLRSQLRTEGKDLPGAALDLSRILELESGRDEVRRLRATIYTTLRLRRLALDDFEALLSTAPADSALLAARDLAAALPEIPPETATQQITAFLRQSATALAKNDEPAATRAFNQAILTATNRDPRLAPEPMRHVERGDLLSAAGHTELATDDYRSARYSGELIPPALLRLARLAFADKDYAVALAHIRSITAEQDPSVAAEAWLLGARAHLGFYQQSPDPESLASAAEALQTARFLEASPASITAIEKEIISLRSRARVNALAAIGTDKIGDALVLARAEAEGTSGTFALYDRLLRLHPANPEIYEARIASIEKSHHKDPRQNAFKTIAAELRAPEPKIPASGAEADLALARASLAVHRRPYLSGPYIERSKVRVTRARAARSPANAIEADAALVDARLAAEIDPHDPQSFVAVAEALVAKKGTLDALQIDRRQDLLLQASIQADRALQLAPDDAALIIWAGDLLRDNGPNSGARDAEALRLYARACRVDPYSTRALIAHGQASMKLGNASAAVADYLRVRRLQPQNLYALYELGVAQLYARAYADATASFKTLEQALAQAGDLTSTDAFESRQLRAVALAAAGDPAAEALAKEVLARSEWIGNAGTALENLTQLKPHAALLDRLLAMKGTRNDALSLNRQNQQQSTIDASPR